LPCSFLPFKGFYPINTSCYSDSSGNPPAGPRSVHTPPPPVLFAVPPPRFYTFFPIFFRKFFKTEGERTVTDPVARRYPPLRLSSTPLTELQMLVPITPPRPFFRPLAPPCVSDPTLPMFSFPLPPLVSTSLLFPPVFWGEEDLFLSLNCTAFFTLEC